MFRCNVLSQFSTHVMDIKEESDRHLYYLHLVIIKSQFICEDSLSSIPPYYISTGGALSQCTFCIPPLNTFLIFGSFVFFFISNIFLNSYKTSGASVIYHEQTYSLELRLITFFESTTNCTTVELELFITQGTLKVFTFLQRYQVVTSLNLYYITGG